MAYISAVKSPDNTTYNIKSYKTAAIAYGTIDSGSTSTVLTATVDGITALYDGVCCYIENGVVTSASGATLNVNSLGAKPIYLSTASATAITTEFDENSTCLFVYNSTRVSGGCWDFFAPSSGESAVQSDWTEDDTTDPAYILNKPAIKAGTGTNSIIEGEFEEPVTGQTIYLTGNAGALTYSFTPQLLTASTGCFIEYNGKNYKAETINIGNSTITFYSTLSSSSALSSTEVTYYNSTFKYSSGNYSHAEGSGTMATGSNSHAEGNSSLAYGGYSHAEGSGCIAQGTYSHAEGRATKAQGSYSHAEGTQTRANGTATHTEGYHTIAGSNYQHVQGKYNIEDANDTYADIVGNGTSNTARSNAYTLDWSGNGWFAGKVTVGTAPTNDLDVATKKYVDDSIPTVPDDLSDLTDVAISSATNGQVLTYNSTSSKWENSNAVNTTYSISMSSNVITLTGSDGNSSTVTLPVYNGSVSSVGGGT